MLDIVVSYHCVQFYGKLTNQTCKNDKKLFFVQFWPIWPKFGPSIFFSKIWHHQSLEIMVSYHHVQYQKKLMIQPWENLVTDCQTDQQTESDFIGHYPKNYIPRRLDQVKNWSLFSHIIIHKILWDYLRKLRHRTF